MGQLRVHNTSRRGCSSLPKKNKLHQRASQRKKKKGALHKELSKRICKKKSKIKKLNRMHIGESSWIDCLKEWGSKRLSQGSQLILEKMLSKGFRYPLRTSVAGATNSLELCQKGITIDVEGYLLISKKKYIMKIINEKTLNNQNDKN